MIPKVNCGVIVMLADAINNHRERFNGKDPMSIWISQETMRDLAREADLLESDDEDIRTMVLFGIPVNRTSAEIPYLRNTLNEMEPL